MKLITFSKLLFNIMARNKNAEYSRYIIAEKFIHYLYPKYKLSDFGRLFLEDDDFIGYHHRYVSRTDYRTLDRRYALDQLMKLVIHLDGDTAECGTFMGASSVLICRHLDGTRKQHHVFDSFAGLSRPKHVDGGYWHEGDLSCSEESARENLKPFSFVVFHRGWIPSKFHEVADTAFSFLHLDVDLHQPTLDSLNFFYERMSRGGIILCDDYGFHSCPGAKAAMDTFFADKCEDVVCLPTGQGLVMKQ